MNRIVCRIEGRANRPWRFSVIVEIRNVILFLLLVNIVGCTPVPPKVIQISKNQSFRPSTPSEVKNVDQAIAAVITAATDAGLPPVDHLSLWLYENTEAFAYWGARQSQIHEVTDIAAFTRGRNIHVNLEWARERNWGPTVGILAHEYGHAMHNVLARNTGKVPFWFAEGFAEWVAAKILNSLSWRSTELTTLRARRELVYHPEHSLSALQDFASWISERRKPAGRVRTYVVSFVVVDQLIRTKGFAAAIDYLKTGDFERSFGQSLPSFEMELAKSTNKQPSTSKEFLIDKPKWEVGFRWQYEVRESGKTGNSVHEIVGTKSTLEGSVFLLTEGNEEYSYSMETLGIVETKKNGNVTTRRNRPAITFSWPLQPEKKWRNTYDIEDVNTKTTDTIDRIMTIPGVEEVKVPAGTFETIKIEAFNYKSGNLVAEYWYSPEVRWFVKTMTYEGVDTYFREQQLVNFKVDKKQASDSRHRGDSFVSSPSPSSPPQYRLR
jgi:hypothetical protein